MNETTLPLERGRVEAAKAFLQWHVRFGSLYFQLLELPSGVILNSPYVQDQYLSAKLGR